MLLNLFSPGSKEVGARGLVWEWEGKTAEGLESLYTGFDVTYVTYCPIHPITISVSTLMPPRLNWAASWPHNSGPLLFVLLLGHPRKLSDDPLPWAPPGMETLPGRPQPLLPQPTRLPWCSAPHWEQVGASWRPGLEGQCCCS